MLLVLVGDKGAGKKTVKNILVDVEGFIETSLENLNPEDKHVLILEKENYYKYEAIKEEKKFLDVIMALDRTGVSDEIENFADITVENKDIADTIERVIEMYKTAQIISGAWFTRRKK